MVITRTGKSLGYINLTHHDSIVKNAFLVQCDSGAEKRTKGASGLDSLVDGFAGRKECMPFHA